MNLVMVRTCVVEYSISILLVYGHNTSSLALIFGGRGFFIKYFCGIKQT